MTDISNDFGTFLDRFRRQDELNLAQMTVCCPRHGPPRGRRCANNSQNFFQTFGERLQSLDQRYRDVCRDLERERVAGRHTQEKAEKLDRDYKTLEESVVRAATIRKRGGGGMGWRQLRESSSVARLCSC